MRRTIGCAAGVALFYPALLAAQLCEPSESSNEARMFASRSLALAQSRGPSLSAWSAGSIAAGFEVVRFPRIKDSDATPDTCNPGKGPEKANIVPGFARIRASVALPGRFVFDASWLPPVEIRGLAGSIIGLGLRRGYGLSQALSLDARAHATFGAIHGPITCDEGALENASSECFGGTLSDDEFKPTIYGGDVTLKRGAPGNALAFYGGTGYSRLTPRFQVNFRNSGGLLDTTRVRVDLHRVALFAGAAWSIAQRWTASAEVYATTEDGATVRVLVDRVLRARR